MAFACNFGAEEAEAGRSRGHPGCTSMRDPVSKNKVDMGPVTLGIGPWPPYVHMVRAHTHTPLCSTPGAAALNAGGSLINTLG